MGCHNVACSISNLSINAGDRLGIIPLWPNVYPRSGKQHILSPGPSFIHCTDVYLPVCFPIFGEYNDYGGLEEIEKNDNTACIESFFGMSIENFVGFITSGRIDIGNPFDAPAGFFCRPELKDFVNISSETVVNFGEEWLLGMGFERHDLHDGQTGFTHPKSEGTHVSVYTASYKDKDKEYKKPSYIITRNGTAIKMGTYHHGKHEFLEDWYRYTGHILYAKDEDQKKIKMLVRMSSMFINRDIYEVISNIETSKKMESWIYSRGSNSPEDMYEKFLVAKKDYDDGVIQFTAAGTPRPPRWMHPLSVGGETFGLWFRDWPFFNKIYTDAIMSGLLKDELLNWIRFESSMYSCNKVFFPTVMGEQGGNDAASRILYEASLKILDEKAKEWD